jgi:hypothetical protein
MALEPIGDIALADLSENQQDPQRAQMLGRRALPISPTRIEDWAPTTAQEAQMTARRNHGSNERRPPTGGASTEGLR